MRILRYAYIEMNGVNCKYGMIMCFDLFFWWCGYMHRKIYISSDYSEASGDRNVVEQLVSWIR